MSCMFSWLYIIRRNVKSMYSMFRKCDSLKKINLFKFNSENVNDMSYMFYGCCSLEKLNFQILILKMLKAWSLCLWIAIR